jgi:hypothetical protein
MAIAATQIGARYDEAGYTGEALRLFGSVPPWAVVHAMTDNSMAPLILKGEVAVIESSGKPGWLPEEGNLYLIEYVSKPFGGEMYERRTRDIVMPRKRKGSWWVGPLCHRLGPIIHMSDGPYPDEIELAHKLIGRVIGIYNPSALAGGAL